MNIASSMGRGLRALTRSPSAKPMRSIAALLGALATCGGSHAGGHYAAGVEGLQAASVPPPGFYYLAYGVNYSIDSFRAPGSRSPLPGDNSGTVSVLAQRLVWITQTKILGADYGMNVVLPLQRTSLTVQAAGISDSRSGVGDIYVEPLLLAWHGPRWDTAVGAGWWFDNGSTNHPASPGKGYRSLMLSGGGTWYFDEARSTSASALLRWERNGRDNSGIRPGNQVSLEWGFGTSLGPVKVGPVGYSQWQTTADQGLRASDQKASKHAVGVQLDYPVPAAGLVLKAALYREWRAEAGSSPLPQGSLLRLTVAKRF